MPKKKKIDPKKLAASLRKRANSTKKRAKKGEDTSQAALRIVREATKD
jgi:hypothetical protein